MLLWPLNEMVDETYTVYWRLCADSGCAPRSAAARGEWRTALGFLLQGQELGNEKLSVAAARGQCERDARCTSFCYNCGPTDCAAGEDEQLVTVYFKTFAEPREQIRNDPNNFWHSHLLEVDAAADSDCERRSAASEQMHLSSYRQGNPFEQT